LSTVRLARSAALAASLVPSSATVPTLTVPAAAHSRKDSTRNPARAASWRARNRAMVTWSGVALAARTREGEVLGAVAFDLAGGAHPVGVGVQQHAEQRLGVVGGVAVPVVAVGSVERDKVELVHHVQE
jgi:hypothetical protein